uniref:Chondroitin proteoglycan 4 domain-containing protein n=1 Tax=Panagrellus redivivus TaxID=6233 RepID=A0A7E4VTB7_PANRE
MMNSKLLVFVIAFAACGILPSTNAFKFAATVSIPPEIFDGPVDASLPNNIRKVICFGKFWRIMDGYENTQNITQADFDQWCKNMTETLDCFSKADFTTRCDKHNNVVGIIDDFHVCGRPILKTAEAICKLTYERAMAIRDCFNAAMSHYSGSPDAAECREKCCHDQSTANASEPILCGPQTHILLGMIRPCDTPAFDQTLKDNACQRACMMKPFARYAKYFCNAEAAAVFDLYGKETRKQFLIAHQCFEKCPCP